MSEVYEVRVGNGTIYWYQNGKYHRLDGPAIEYADGTKYWYQKGCLHRFDGPAVEGKNEYKAWYQYGMLHRLDGPAVEYANGTKYWYINGGLYTEAEFLAKTAPTKELTVEEVSKLLGYNVKIVKG